MITYFWAAGIGLSIIIFAGKAGLVAGSANLSTPRIIALALVYGVLAFAMGLFSESRQPPELL
jgi:predicted transporter